MKYSVQAGFAFVILLMVLVSSGVLYQTNHAKNIMTDLVEISNAKVELAHTMLEVIHRRDINSLAILSARDLFEVDDHVMDIYSLARDYREAREKLMAIPMSRAEKVIHAKLTQLTRAAQPITRELTEAARSQIPKQELVEIYNKASEARAPMYRSLDELILLQKKYASDALEKSRDLYNETIWWVITLTALLVVFTFSTAILVSKMVAKKNQELIVKNRDLERAYAHAEEATRAKSSFLATMSHEIRTPITAIIGFAESTFFSNQNMQMRQRSVRNIIHSGKHLLQIINDMLDLSKIEANKMSIEKQPTSVFDVVKGSEVLLKTIAGEKDLDFSVNYRYPLPAEIETDPLRLKQIILNLGSNAIKFTDEGFVRINVGYLSHENQCVIEVVDSGIGLTRSEIKKVFEPFKQVDSSHNRRHGGTGLGLSLSKRLAESLGGTLNVESNPGQGSTFSLIFDAGDTSSKPFINSAKDQPVVEGGKVEVLEHANFDGRVLIVEDNEFNRELLQLFLQRVGLDCVLAENGLVGVDLAQQQDFDLVIMDIQMPVMDGLEATITLREGGFTKPIVALTANAMEEDRHMCMQAGCNDYLTKPIDNNKFFEMLARYLNKPDEQAVAQARPEPVYSDRLVNGARYDMKERGLVERFALQGLPRILHEIDQAICNMDVHLLSDKLDQLKHAGSNAGYLDFINIAQKMEFQILNEDKRELTLLFGQLHNLYLGITAGLEISPISLISDNSQSI